MIDLDPIAVDKALMAAGDERAKHARNEQERGREAEAHGEPHKAKLAHKHAWALRQQADGLWEAAALVRKMTDPEPLDSGEGNR